MPSLVELLIFGPGSTCSLPLKWYTLGRRMFKKNWAGQCAEKFGSMTRFKIMERMSSPPAGRDFFSNFPITATEKRRVPIKMPEIIVENRVMLCAGSDTTQSALTYTMFCTQPIQKSSAHFVRYSKRLCPPSK